MSVLVRREPVPNWYAAQSRKTEALPLAGTLRMLMKWKIIFYPSTSHLDRNFGFICLFIFAYEKSCVCVNVLLTNTVYMVRPML